nr:MAG TPA: hypothetical protein [Caudoviricetes sp.]
MVCFAHNKSAARSRSINSVLTGANKVKGVPHAI